LTKKQSLLAGMAGAILLGILFFGLNPRDFTFSNGADWISEGRGLHFEKYGIAYTDSVAGLKGDTVSSGFSMEIAFKPESDHEEGFNLLFVIYVGNDRTQLIVGQYRSWIVIMNGDDYSHKRKTRRIAIDIASKGASPIFLTLTAGKAGTSVYVDGQLVATRSDLALTLPVEGGQRFLFGNSVYGRHSWKGDVYGFAFYPHVLAAATVKTHFHSWDQDERFQMAKDDTPFTCYLFDEKDGERVLDHGSGQNDLKVPSRMAILAKQILSLPWIGFELNKGALEDILLNLVGFIPLGCILPLIWSTGYGFSRNRAVLLAVVCCFIVSLTIEVLQAWMPSRSSQMMDLVLNTVGGALGAMAGRCWSLVEGRRM
jgi:hypothetical protein